MRVPLLAERGCHVKLPPQAGVPPVPNLVLACGHGHFGLAGAPMSARLVAAALLGGSPPIDPPPYALSRFHWSTGSAVG